MKKKIAISLLAVLATTYTQAQESEYQWSSLPVGGGGFVTGLVNSPKEKGLMYARTDVGGAFRWDDETESWIPLLDWISESEVGFLGVESMAIDPNAPNVLYMYLGTSYWNDGLSAIVRSEDYGKTFTRQCTVTAMFPAHGNGVGRASGEMLAVCPWNSDQLICGSRTKGVWRSTNQGKNWKRIGRTVFPDDCKVGFVQFVEHDSTIYVGLQVKDTENVFISKDEGETWTALNGQPTQYMPHRCTLSQDSIIYFAYSDSQGPSTGEQTGAIMKYDTYTDTWTDISPSHLSFGDVAVSESNPNLLVTSTYSMWRAINWVSGTTQWGDQIFVSRNGGETWTNLMTSGKARFKEPLIKWAQGGTAQLHWCGSIRMDPFNSQRAFFISGNGIFVTENLWSSSPKFKMAVTGLEETVPTSLANVIGSPVVTTLGDLDGFVYYDIHEYYNKHTPAMGTTGYCCIAGLQPLTFVRLKSNSPQIYLTEDGAETWEEILGPKTVTEEHPYQYAALGASGKMLMVAPYEMKPIYTTDRGKTWNEVPGVTTHVPMHADCVEDNVFYIYQDDRLYTYTLNSETGKMKYTYKSIPNVMNERTMAVVPGMAGEIWMARGSDGLAHVSNGHTGFPKVKYMTLSYVRCVGVGKPKSEEMYPVLYIWGKPKASDKMGIYRSEDEGRTWTRINDDMHQYGGPGNAQFVKGDMNVYGRVYMSTVGRGVICGELVNEDSGAIEEINDEDRSSIQSGVYDLNGRKVAEGSNIGNLPTGIYITNGKKSVVK